MRLLWLAEDCRRAGLTVVEVKGWQTRGVEFPIIPNTVLAHHTATAASRRGDLPTEALLIAGRSPDNPDAPDHLPGPLCQVALGRNGTVYVIASGKANQAGKGAWRGETSSSRTIGVEAENPGDDKPWPKKQYDAYVILAATLLRGLGQNADRVCAHREWALPAGRKQDVRFDMDVFRREVAAWLEPHDNEGDDEMTPEQEAALIAKTAKATADLIRKDLAVLLHGTKDGTHPANLDNIWKAVEPK